MHHDYQTRCKQLLELYGDLCSAAGRLPTELIDRLGCPFLPFPREKWYQANHRILVIGQEPFEWGFEGGLHYKWPHPAIWSLKEALAYRQSVEALTCAYKTHTYLLESPYRPAPFEQAFNILMSSADRDGSGDVLGTNLFRCTLDIEANPDSRSPLAGTQGDIQQIVDWQRGCLAGEVRILDPTAVVFFTGPRYDAILRSEFPGLELNAVAGHTSRQFAEAVHPALPNRAFRTYHPSYLRRSGKWSWVKEIAELVVTSRTV